MLNQASSLKLKQAFETDTYAWFKGQRHGHMGKWQYGEPEYEGDPVRGAKLWDIWEQAATDDNMLARQGRIIKEQIDDMISLTKPRHTLIDLGPGGLHAVMSNTIPFIEGYNNDLDTYIAIDLASGASEGAVNKVSSICPELNCFALNDDFLKAGLHIPATGQSAALFMGGTIGNFEAEPNTSQAIELMAKKIVKLKQVLPDNTVVFIGLEATQDPDMLYTDYDDPRHAEYEINLMHQIKRDIIPDEEGFDPYAWKYSMAWYPDAHQFCHIAKSTTDQKFSMWGDRIHLPKGTQLVVDNSFKFPILAMQKSALLAGTEYLRPFTDRDGRMAIHALKL
jgi:uncharacterized SAM-dependent methyltransferase